MRVLAQARALALARALAHGSAPTIALTPAPYIRLCLSAQVLRRYRCYTLAQITFGDRPRKPATQAKSTIVAQHNVLHGADAARLVEPALH